MYIYNVRVHGPTCILFNAKRLHFVSASVASYEHALLSEGSSLNFLKPINAFAQIHLPILLSTIVLIV